MISSEDIRKLALLARIKVPADEEDALAKDMEHIVEYVNQIRDAGDDASNMKGSTESSAGNAIHTKSLPVKNVLRKDENPHESGMYTDALLREVPELHTQFVKVKKVL